MVVDFNINLTSIIGGAVTLGGAILGLIKYIDSKEKYYDAKLDGKANKDDIKEMKESLSEITKRIDMVYGFLVKNGNGNGKKEG